MSAANSITALHLWRNPDLIGFPERDVSEKPADPRSEISDRLRSTVVLKLQYFQYSIQEATEHYIFSQS